MSQNFLMPNTVSAKKCFCQKVFLESPAIRPHWASVVTLPMFSLARVGDRSPQIAFCIRGGTDS